MEYKSTDFLYHSLDTILTSVEIKLKLLQLKYFLIKALIKALVLFYKNDAVWEFDPHVGETSCQIRAYKLFILKTNKHECLMVEQNIEKCKKSLQKISVVMSALKDVKNRHLKEISSPEKLEAFLYRNELVFHVSSSEVFLLQSYVLTFFKEEDVFGNTYINFEKVMDEAGVSRKTAKKIIHDYQVKLALSSVSFIDELASQISQKTMINRFCYHDDDARPVLPCYLAIKILWTHMLKTNTPVILIAHIANDLKNSSPIIVMFKPSRYKKCYEFFGKLDVFSGRLDQPCIVIEGLTNIPNSRDAFGYSDYVNCLKPIGLDAMVFGNMANHPQFSGNKLSTLSFNPFEDTLAKLHHDCVVESADYRDELSSLHQELLEMKRIGIQIGCSEVNQRLFFIRHIFCSTPQQELSRFEKLTLGKPLLCSTIENYLNESMGRRAVNSANEYYGQF